MTTTSSHRTTATIATGPPTDRQEPGRRPTETYALVAGLGLLAMTVVGVFANFVAIGGLITEGDAVATAADITDSETLFRIGILGQFAVAVLDLVVAWALFNALRSTNESVARFSAWVRATYAGTLVVAVTHLQAAVRHLDDGNVLVRIDAYNDTWALGLGVFGIHLIVLGWLVWKAPWLPRLLGALVALAGIGYVADTVGTVISAGYGGNVAAFTFFGEPLLMVWLIALVWKATRNPMSGPSDASVTR